jgi:NAD dependent epimerase/dehydratase family enzyme
MSWIERDDLIRLIAHAIADPALKGPVNATAPEPVRNAAFARELGRALHRPAFLAIPAPLLRLLGDLADELLLGGQRVVPEKALKSGFMFRHATLRSALGAMLGGETHDAGQRTSIALHLPAPAKK